MFINKGSDNRTIQFLKKSQEIVVDSNINDTDSNEFEKRNYTISGYSNTLDALEKMIGYMEHLGKVGHSTSFKVGVDGNGGFSIETKEGNKNSLSKKWKMWGDEVLTDSKRDIDRFDFY